MDNLTSIQRSKIMRAICSTNTKDEVRLTKALWHLGYRYRKNNKKVFGTPNLTFKKLKIALFVDSEFFQGRDWEIHKRRFKSNQEFWQKKIEHNMQRDIQVNEHFMEHCWIVLRFWSSEIKNNLQVWIAKIQTEIALKPE